MKNRKLDVAVIAVAMVFILASLLFMFKDRIHLPSGKMDESSIRHMPEADSVSDELVNGVIIEQSFDNDIDAIKNVAVVFTKYDREAHGQVTFELLEGGTILFSKIIDIRSISEQHRVFFTPNSSLTGMSGKKLTIRLYADSSIGGGVGLMIRTADSGNSVIRINSRNIRGTICFSINESKN